MLYLDIFIFIYINIYNLPIFIYNHFFPYIFYFFPKFNTIKLIFLLSLFKFYLNEYISNIDMKINNKSIRVQKCAANHLKF